MINRIAWLDALKGFAIFTVVLGHCVTDCLASNTFPKDKEMLQIVYDFIYSFHMPLFFLISGYLFYLTKSYRKYEIKVIDFMIIYLLWNVLTWFLKFFMADAVNNPDSLQIYLVHCFITAGTRFGLRYLNIVNLPLYFILGTLLGLLIPIGLAKWCNGKGLLNFPFAPIKEIKKIGVIKI